MMTLEAMAQQLNTSTMTIYRKLKRVGRNIKDFRDADGNLTVEGMNIIAGLFDATSSTTSVQQPAPHDPTVLHNTIQQEVVPEAVTIAVLEARLEAANETIQRLEEERDRLIKQLEATTAALEREQADRASERLMLTSRSDADRSKGFFQRLFRH